MRIQQTPCCSQARTTRQANPNFGNLKLTVLESARTRELATDQVGTVIAKKLIPFLKKYGLNLAEGLDGMKNHQLYIPMKSKTPLKSTVRAEIAKFFKERVKVANCSTNEMRIAQIRLESALEKANA